MWNCDISHVSMSQIQIIPGQKELRGREQEPGQQALLRTTQSPLIKCPGRLQGLCWAAGGGRKIRKEKQTMCVFQKVSFHLRFGSGKFFQLFLIEPVVWRKSVVSLSHSHALLLLQFVLLCRRFVDTDSVNTDPPGQHSFYHL